MSAARVAVTLERMLADCASQLGETDSKVIQKWRHEYRDRAKRIVNAHYVSGSPYMVGLLTIANDVKNKIEEVYRR